MLRFSSQCETRSLTHNTEKPSYFLSSLFWYFFPLNIMISYRMVGLLRNATVVSFPSLSFLYTQDYFLQGKLAIQNVFKIALQPCNQQYQTVSVYSINFMQNRKWEIKWHLSKVTISADLPVSRFISSLLPMQMWTSEILVWT